MVIVENGAWLASDIEIQTDTKVVIGSGTTVQRRCTINGSTRIGRACLLAPNVFISSGSHPFRVVPHLHIREQEKLLRESTTDASNVDRPVWIQDDCWLGVNSVVSPGVTVGKGSVVGANAVVTHDVPPYSVVAGIPARVISGRLAWVPPTRIDLKKSEDLIYVLAGFVTGEGSGSRRHIAVTADEPMLAALAPTVRAIAVRYRASCNLELEVGRTRVSVREGEDSFVVPTIGLPMRHGAVMFELVVVKAAAFGVLQVSSLEGVNLEEAVI
jgi:acetyltransferase-like isoleucine patch superfamily enzyme